MRSLVIGTRGSTLAMRQAEQVAAELRVARPGLDVTLQVIRTSGDIVTDVPLAQVGGKGLFVKEIEGSLLAGQIDIAVHSAKDMPSELPAGLGLAAIPKRVDPRDLLIARADVATEATPDNAETDIWASLPQGARVGTCSPRRACQLKARRRDLDVVPLRGNVETRLRRLREGDFAAIVLAAAGIARLALDVSDCAIQPLAEGWVEAVGQGALGIETRIDDVWVNSVVMAIDDEATRHCVTAERAMLKRLGGGCNAPVGGHATLREGQLTLRGLIGHPSGDPIVAVEKEGSVDAAEVLGEAVGEALLAQGGDRILREL